MEIHASVMLMCNREKIPFPKLDFILITHASNKENSGHICMVSTFIILSSKLNATNYLQLIQSHYHSLSILNCASVLNVFVNLNTWFVLYALAINRANKKMKLIIIRQKEIIYMHTHIWNKIVVSTHFPSFLCPFLEWYLIPFTFLYRFLHPGTGQANGFSLDELLPTGPECLTN